MCEGEIREMEIAEALKEMQTGSVPGSDGLTTEFFDVFWPGIKHMLLDLYTHLLKAEYILSAQKKA